VAPRLLMKARVVEARREAEDIRSLRFAPVHRKRFPSYPGGAHTILQLGDGTRRSYSLCGDPHDTSTYQIAVLREAGGRGGSRRLHDEVQVGDLLYLSHPQDAFGLDPDARRHVLVAGGIGITPLLSMLHDLPAQASAELHYCVRSRARAAFLERLAELPVEVHLYVADEGRRLDVATLVAATTPGTSLYCCGPDRLIHALRTSTADWPPGTVHIEAFSGLSGQQARQGEPFEVDLTLTQRRVSVPAHQTLLDALRDVGVPVDASCEGGICRTCVVDVVEGEPIHRDMCLSDQERRGALTACVSRGRGLLRLLL
jgi:ferredoxin-NADP reductase